MNDNLPAVRTQETDSWVQQMGPIVNLANHIAKTEFVPKGLRGSEAATAAAILYGREVGLPPMTALQQIHVIEGKPAVSAEGMRAMIFAAGHEIEVVEANGARVVMRGRRRGSDSWTSLEWSLDMARAAGLAGKQVWKAYPRAMLTARCTAELARMVFPDVIHGFRAVEETEDIEGPAEGSGPASSSSTVQRKSRSRAGTKGEAAAEGPRERPALTGPPLPGEPGYTETPGAGSGGEATPPVPGPDTGGGLSETPDPSPVQDDPIAPDPDDPEHPDDPAEQDKNAAAYDPPRPATKADLRMYHASWNPLLKQLSEGADADATRLTLTARIIGRHVDTSNNLTQQEARTVADTCARCSSVEELVELLDAIEYGDRSDES